MTENRFAAVTNITLFDYTLRSLAQKRYEISAAAHYWPLGYLRFYYECASPRVGKAHVVITKFGVG